MGSFSRQLGVTFVEVMVTVAVIGILASVAVPSYTDYIARERLNGAVEAIYGQVQLAKRQAISNNDTRYLIIDEGSNWCAGVSEISTSVCSTLDVFAQGSNHPGSSIDTTISPIGFVMPALSATSSAITVSINSADDKTISISANQLVEVD